MTSPRFFDRFADAALPLLEGADRATLRVWLEELGLTLTAPPGIADHPVHQEGFMLACNLAARLYPRLCIEAPPEVAERARQLALAINPACALLDRPRPEDTALCWAQGTPAARVVVVNALAWTAYLDHDGPGELSRCEAPAALAAAAIGAANAFRAAFAEQLGGRGRTGPEPGRLNVVTQDASIEALVPLSDPVDIGTVHLAGCGAIGEACALTLGASPVRGTLWAIDHEKISLSNLQRYVLAVDADVGAPKPALVARQLAATTLKVKQLQMRWGGHKSAGPGAKIVLTALDTGADRIDVQGSLPQAIYNAYTQPNDLGVSRHERFGREPCLACLYWPTTTIPGRHEQIAGAIGEHPLRVLGYLVHGIPVGKALPPEAIQVAGSITLPENSDTWTERSLLEDLAERRELAGAQFEPWSELTAEDFYVSAVCGGGLVTDVGAERDVVVPLAHQSALAGVLLAMQLIAAKHPRLAARRPAATRGWLNMMHPLPQAMAQAAGRSMGCLCSDADFVGHWERTWGEDAAE